MEESPHQTTYYINFLVKEFLEYLSDCLFSKSRFHSRCFSCLQFLFLWFCHRVFFHQFVWNVKPFGKGQLLRFLSLLITGWRFFKIFNFSLKSNFANIFQFFALFSEIMKLVFPTTPKVKNLFPSHAYNITMAEQTLSLPRKNKHMYMSAWINKCIQIEIIENINAKLTTKSLVKIWGSLKRLGSTI